MSSKNITARIKNTRHRDMIQRFFGDLPVVEAKKELRIQPSTADIEGATPGDPTQCVFARACRRMWDSTAAVFFTKIAYVDLIDHKTGNRRIERFVISAKGRRAIRDFDEGKTLQPDGFLLCPPSLAETLAGQTACVKGRPGYLAARTRPAVIVGEKREKKARTGEANPSFGRLRHFRNGQGMVHFAASQ